MVRKRRTVVLSMGLAAFVVGCGQRSTTSGEAKHGMARADSAPIRSPQPQNPVRTVTLPHDEPLLPPGPGQEEFVAACVVCHSPRYITMQPPFTRSAWLGEINKMKDVYGGHISDQQVPRILDYLVSINGMPDPVGAPTTAIHGE
jgi:mono/diheme cytochrome c family protein